ncbi:hypothetical protein BpHYR1_042767 [Brachionus plicatilis]|uniref:Uncharacterized protein n=1 Tax=Brachionus plicatilis TaxID=10195 RepID=A0A3M7SC19_BRAPC|nr:hypothetical protein BpHYR1_042767 [Brachionus plicatilis]
MHFRYLKRTCQVGVFLDSFSRNAFDLVQNCHIVPEIRTDKSIKRVRQTVNEMSIGGGQGMLATRKIEKTGKIDNFIYFQNLLLVTTKYFIRCSDTKKKST